MGRARLAVDDAAEPEALRLEVGGDRSREATPPEALGGDGVVKGAESGGLHLRAALVRRGEIHHALRQGEALHGEAPRHDGNPSRGVMRRSAAIHKPDAPRRLPGLLLEVHADQRSIAIGIREEEEWPAGHDTVYPGRI